MFAYKEAAEILFSYYYPNLKTDDRNLNKNKTIKSELVKYLKDIEEIFTTLNYKLNFRFNKIDQKD